MEADKIIRKLRMDKAAQRLIINAPKEFLTVLKKLPHDTIPSKAKAGKYDYIQVFASTQADLEKLAKQMAPYGMHDCLFWACYPKGTGKIKSDIKRETVWAAFELVGLQAVSQIAIDETWSALRARPADAVGS